MPDPIRPADLVEALQRLGHRPVAEQLGPAVDLLTAPARLAAAQRRIDALEADLAEHIRKLSSAHADLTTARTDAASQRVRADQAEQCAEDARRAAGVAEQRLAHHQANVEEAQRIRHKYLAALAEARDETARIIGAARKEIEGLERQGAHARAAAGHKESELSRLRGQLAEVREAKDRFKAAYEHLQRAYGNTVPPPPGELAPRLPDPPAQQPERARKLVRLHRRSHPLPVGWQHSMARVGIPRIAEAIDQTIWLARNWRQEVRSVRIANPELARVAESWVVAKLRHALGGPDYEITVEQNPDGGSTSGMVEVELFG